MIKKCVICGKEFEGKGNAVTCSVPCRKVNGYKYISKPGPRRTKTIVRLSIAEVNALARKEGLSYGEYVARCCNG